MKKNILSLFLLSLVLMLAVGCSVQNKDNNDSSIIDTTNEKLVYEESISPNKDYVTSSEDVVNYKIQIFQDKENKIIVNADSNSKLFDKIQYVVEYDKQITKEDIKVKWTTFMGNSEHTKDDQLAVADISIYSNGEVFSQRKINFVNKGMEIVVDAINQK